MTTTITPPLAHRLPAAAKLVGVSPRTMWEFVARGEIAAARVGSGKRRMLLIPHRELERWLAERTSKEGDR